MSALRILIIGSSITGLAAAEAARAKDEAASITVVSEDSYPPYYRQRLCEVLEDRTAAERLMLHPDSWYAQRRIDLRLNTKVSALDAQAGHARLSDGGVLPFDRVVLATGSSSFVPPITGAGLPGVETLWTMAEALRIEGRIGAARRALVIGGGLLGLDAAWALHRRGLPTAILERLPRLMMRQLDERSGELFAAQVEKEGSSVVTGALIKEIFSGPDGRAAGVRLEDGSEYAADLILLSTGVQARRELAAGSGIAADRWIAVDDRMRTSMPHVYAAGDCAATDGKWYDLWGVARAQGAVAGENAAGGDARYDQVPPPYVVNTMGTRIASAGAIEESGLSEKELERLHADILVNSELFEYAKKLYVGDRLSGFILLGDTKAFSSLNRELWRVD